jgi:hypothetical protein
MPEPSGWLILGAAAIIFLRMLEALLIVFGLRLLPSH